jgi:2-polyprenyl-6-methoxyphenol hydroxylase-like FAD-dependent oxidoreductase
MVAGRIVIAGAGVGGLSLAAALKRSGRDVIVLERARSLERGGAGISVQANAVKALREIGLADAVVAAGQILRKIEIRHYKGRVLARPSAVELERRFGAPMVALHRGRLLDVLSEAAGEGTVKYGFGVATYEQTAKDVTAVAEDDREVKGAILVGADGLWSRVRAKLVGDGPPRYAGYTSWRGIVDAADLVEEGYSSESWGIGQRFGIVSIGRGQVYWFATANAKLAEKDAADPVDALLLRFRGWHAPIEHLLARTWKERVIRTDIQDRAPIRRWSDGRVVLLGDAAHPMTPNLGQGGCQAIEDAVSLGRVVGEHDDVTAAFRAYEAARVDRANDLVRRARSFGELAQWSGGLRRFVRDTAVRLTPEALFMKQLRAVLTFES